MWGIGFEVGKLRGGPVVADLGLAQGNGRFELPIATGGTAGEEMPTGGEGNEETARPSTPPRAARFESPVIGPSTVGEAASTGGGATTAAWSGSDSLSSAALAPFLPFRWPFFFACFGFCVACFGLDFAPVFAPLGAVDSDFQEERSPGLVCRGVGDEVGGLWLPPSAQPLLRNEASVKPKPDGDSTGVGGRSMYRFGALSSRSARRVQMSRVRGPGSGCSSPGT